MEPKKIRQPLAGIAEENSILIEQCEQASTTIKNQADDPVPGPSHAGLETQPQLTEAKTNTETKTKRDTPKPTSGDDDIIVDEGFVMLEPDENFKYEKMRSSFFAQMESMFSHQIQMLDYYKKVFERQSNDTMATRFGAYLTSSGTYLDLIKMGFKNKESMPKFKFEQIIFNCLPVNVEIKEKELQLVVKTLNLPVTEGAQSYIIAEFAFPHPKEETVTESFARWLHYVKIEPKNLFFCSTNEPAQLDIVYSTDQVLFYKPESKSVEYNRPLSFFVDKGKSRTLKRKFKPVKLTFYEKTSFLTCDKKIGTVQVKVDSINDDVTTILKMPIMDGRKQLEATADIRVKVREPLVNKTIRAHEERILILN